MMTPMARPEGMCKFPAGVVADELPAAVDR
jgi:hypothetical protein